MQAKMDNLSLFLYTLLVLTGCVSLPNVKVDNVQDRQVAYTSKGVGTPVIVLESGLGPSMTTWAPIFESLAEITRVFAYDRPGYGHSSLHQYPETARELAEQLRQNLITTGHSPPYLLAGHSAGGLYVNVFARLYPNDVAGVVLIDATHPSQFEYFREEQPILYSTFITTSAMGKTRYEATILKNMHTEFASIGRFPDVPLVVLTAEKSSIFETQKMRNKWLEFQQDLASMSTKATHKVVAGSGHFIHKDKPNIVINEIKEIVAASRKIQ
ncbi:MAG: alpha/beta hydrolase [Gammaproteobacteria bacterium]|nr:alpha/beta hydrolase [Gammaproteobacteria bacterium]MDH3466357.1 alpha/beta hydrolase [Gammaproteobacteria bacterium]